MELDDDATIVWNRACQAEVTSTSRPGDVALTNAILFEGLGCNGGIDHAFDGREALVAAAIAGYEHLGLADLAQAIRDLRDVRPDETAPDEAFEEFEQMGAERFLDREPGHLLQAALAARLLSDRDDFAPISEVDRAREREWQAFAERLTADQDDQPTGD